jgi:hypothetical protein
MSQSCEVIALATTTTETIPVADIAPPADATKVYEWEFVGDGPYAQRFFVGAHRGAKVRVCIHGFQYSDGKVKRWISVSAGRHGEELDVDEATDVSRDFQAAVEELGALAD